MCPGVATIASSTSVHDLLCLKKKKRALTKEAECSMFPCSIIKGSSSGDKLQSWMFRCRDIALGSWCCKRYLKPHTDLLTCSSFLGALFLFGKILLGIIL